MHIRSFFAAVALLTVSACANATMVAAADLPPLKPPARSAFVYPGYEGSGFYWGFDVEAGAAQSHVSDTAFSPLITGNLTAAGGSVGGTVGWMTGVKRGTPADAPGKGMWGAFELTVLYQNITATEPNNVTLRSRWSAEQAIKLGGFQQPLAWLGNLGLKFPTFPDIPAPGGFNIAANTSHPYIKAGVAEFGLTASAVDLAGGNTWAAAPMLGAGVMNQLLGADGKLSGAVLDVGAKAIFASKGVAFNFQDGVPAAKLQMGNQYFAYAKVLF